LAAPLGRRAPGAALKAAAAAWLAAVACAGHGVRVPDSLRDYEVVVSERDSLGAALRAALAQEGFRTRQAVRGGARPAAVLVHFVMRASAGSPAQLHGWLADTRTGRIVAAGGVALDSVGPGGAERAAALVRRLVSVSP
jgi:hypothetical protein